MDLKTTYLKLELEHPFMAGASPLADDVERVRELVRAGASAVVMRSLFEEQLQQESLATHSSLENPAESFGEAVSYFPSAPEFTVGPDEYLERIRRLKEAVDVPVIASLNGCTLSGWLDHARRIEDAGADALELNLYGVPTDFDRSGEAIETTEVAMVRAVREGTRLPVAVKLSPFYTSLPHFAARLADAGAAALVLFNRFYEPDIDIEELEVAPHLELSTPAELLLRLRWLAVLSERLPVTLAVSGGVHSVADAVKAVMCGAHAVQIVSALLDGGGERLAEIRRGFVDWMTERGYESLDQLRGSMNLRRCPNPQAYARANYIHLLDTWRRE